MAAMGLSSTMRKCVFIKCTFIYFLRRRKKRWFIISRLTVAGFFILVMQHYLTLFSFECSLNIGVRLGTFGILFVIILKPLIILLFTKHISIPTQTWRWNKIVVSVGLLREGDYVKIVMPLVSSCSRNIAWK